MGRRASDLRASWPQALLTFFSPLLLLALMRWLLIEPYVIPSGSMIPTLLIHDHIFVNKLAYGVHWPFQTSWLARWSEPERFDVVVFRFPDNPRVFYVKRIVGLPGDRVGIDGHSLVINGEKWPAERLEEFASDDYQYYREDDHFVRYRYEGGAMEEFTVPEGHFFAVGDNRDESSDSRVWGTVPLDHVVGRASFIWLSCRETLATARFLCDPQTIRWNRLFQSVGKEPQVPFEE